MRRVLIACAVVLGLAYAVGIPLFLGNEDTSLPSRADAVVALSSSEETLPEAQRLVQRGLAPVLVVSTERGGSKERETLCRSRPRPKGVVCVNADPFTTSSESQVIARLASDRKWSTLVVVTPDYQSFRMERTFGRCPDVTVVVHSVDEPRWRALVGIPLEWVKLGVAETVRRDC